MTSTYSSNLRLELIGTGDQSSTWGTTTNINLGTLLEQAISGVSDVVFSSDADKTLSTVNGGTDEARQMIISLTSTVVGGLTATRNVIVPSVDKLYVVKNGTSGGQSIVVKTSAGTGITITNGETTMVWCDGTNVYSALDYTPALTIGAGGLSLQGNFNVGGSAPNDAVGINVDTTLATSTTTQYGVLVQPTYDDTATVGSYGYRSLLTGGSAASSYTTSSVYNYRSGNFTLGTNQVVTNFYGFYGDDLTTATNNYGVSLNTAAAAASTITSIVGSAGTVTVTTSGVHGLATGDKVLIANVTGAMTSGSYNGGPYTVTVTSTTVFTYSSAATSSALTTGSVVKANNWNVYAAGTGNNLFSGPVITSTSSTLPAMRITQTGTGDAFVVEDSTNPDTTPFVIDTSGRVIQGYTASIAIDSDTPNVQINSGSSTNNGIGNYSWTASTGASYFEFAKSRSAAIGTNSIVTSGDNLGFVRFFGDDGTGFVKAAEISAAVDGTPDDADMPGRLVFSTTADGASTPTERMRITSDGSVGIGTTSPDGNLEVSGTATTQYITRYSTDTSSANLLFRKSRGTEAARTTVVSGDNIGELDFSSYDGTGFTSAADIIVDSEGTIGTNRVPGRMLLRTGTNASPTVVATAIEINSSQVTNFTNGIQVNSINAYALKTVSYKTGSGTYTTPSKVRAIYVECVGGGGGGGGVDGSGVTNSAAVSGGGGGGGAIQALITSPEATYTFAVGAAGSGGAGLAGANGATGGTSSFTGSTATLTATGGGGGIGNAATTGTGITTGGSGGLGSITGSVTSSSILKGIAGGSGQTSGGTVTSAPNSGCCPLFGGGMVGVTTVNGTDATVFGEGGSSTRVGAVTSNYRGGDGFAGTIRITEYY